MFERPGEIIKKIAVAFFVIELIAAVGFGLYSLGSLFQNGLGLLIIVGGVAAAYYTSLFMYGIGQLIDNSDKIVASLEEMKKTMQKMDVSDGKRLEGIEKDELPDL